MLKVVDLHKKYKSKKGADHEALKGINLELGSRGFVFVLGKSGCGKSTLLNVLGGLDKFDKGDIVIKDKSSKSFKPGEWDSYRNTYLGFVFQEFNLIENYSIGKNIRLALELQSFPKKDIKKRVNEILKQVGLDGMGKRKPNELSGGQKQRIAIARALVKDPEIILADEPTGNLDSETGKQIIEILRELSERKLVIMVSHDKESAYNYADRIITLSDGKVIGDELNEGGQKYIGSEVDHYRTEGEITRVIRIPKGKKISEEKAIEINKVLSGNNGVVYLPITKGKPLTKKDLDLINKFTRGGSRDTYIPIAEDVMKVQGTTDKQYESRENPAEKSKTEETEPFKLIKSRLPFKDSLKMAINNVFRKKIKLFFTVLLFLVSLAMFGFSETVTKFDFAQSIANSYSEGNIDIISLTNTTEIEDQNRTEDITVPFEAKKLSDITSSYTNLSYGKGHNFISNNVLENPSSDFIAPKKYVGFLELNSLEDLDLELEVGTFPKDYSEVVISDFFADYYISEEAKYTEDLNLVGIKITIDYKDYTISGVLKTDYKDFEELNNYSPAQLQQEKLLELSEFNEKNNTVYSRIIVKEGFYDNYADSIDAISRLVNFQVDKKDPENQWDIYDWLSDSIYKLDSASIDKAIEAGDLFIDPSVTSLKDNEIIADMYTLQQMLHKDDNTEAENIIHDFEKTSSQKYSELLEKGYMNFEVDIHQVDEQNWMNIKTRTVKVVGVINFHQYINRIEGAKLAALLEAKGAVLDSWQKEDFWSLERMMEDYDIDYTNPYKNFHSPIILSENLFNEVSPVSKGKTNELIVNLSDNNEYNIEFFTYAENESLDHNTASGGILGMFKNFTDEAKNIFKYVSLVFALFATVLLFTNISSSILNKKKEIGTLRAIGARGRDVASIFITEGIILGLFTTILAIIALNTITVVINSNLSDQIGLKLSIFNSSLIIFGEMIAMALGIVIVAAFLPVKKVSSMKPIDAIRNK